MIPTFSLPAYLHTSPACNYRTSRFTPLARFTSILRHNTPTRATARRKRIRRANCLLAVDSSPSSRRIRRPGEPFTASSETRWASLSSSGQGRSSRVRRLRNCPGSLTYYRILFYLHWSARLEMPEESSETHWLVLAELSPGICLGRISDWRLVDDVVAGYGVSGW